MFGFANLALFVPLGNGEVAIRLPVVGIVIGVEMFVTPLALNSKV